MKIDFYKTTDCPACAMLLKMLPSDEKINVINLTDSPEKTPEGLKGVPHVVVDGKVLDNPFGLVDIMSKRQ